MITLRDFYEWNTLCLLTDKFQLIEVLAVRSNEIKETNGFFSYVEKDLLALFVYKKKIFLNINQQCYSGEEVCAEFYKSGDWSYLTIKISRLGLHYQFKYENTDDGFMGVTSSFDREDKDFGLWLYNILCSEDRKKIFIENN